MVEAVVLGRSREHFAQDVGAGAGGVLLVSRRHVAGAHRAAAELGFTAVARAIALLGVLQDRLVLEAEVGLELGI